MAWRSWRCSGLTAPEQSFDRALLFQPRHVEALVGKGVVGIELRHYDEAEAALAAALDDQARFGEDPGAARTAQSRQLSRLEQAAADFDAALALSPRLEVALRGKAQVSLSTWGTRRRRSWPAQTLLEENPRSTIALALLSSCFANQGEIASAIEHLDAALAIAPDPDLIARKIYFLDFLPDADFTVQQAARKSLGRSDRRPSAAKDALAPAARSRQADRDRLCRCRVLVPLGGVRPVAGAAPS